MPAVHPFRAIQYNQGTGDVSDLIAPPYDVLDLSHKDAMLAKNPDNIVAVDLPHVPAKELGPAEAYEASAKKLRDMIDAGTMKQSDTPAMFAYRQTFEFHGETYQRCGMVATLDTVPFGNREGGGILAHEQTFGGPKEDRMALMKATQCQTSPIFGLHPDEGGDAVKILHSVMDARDADMIADMGDDIKQEIWTISDESTIAAYQKALAGEDIFVADGHHRYNTALNYLESLGDVPADHPARRTMFVLVSMSDPGLAIGPTHRVLGGMEDYEVERFIEAAQGLLNVEPIDNDPMLFESQMETLAERERTPNVFGIYDYATGLCFGAWPAVDDPLDAQFPKQSQAWRTLDVALIQHLIVEEICQPELNNGEPVKWAFPHSIEEVIEIGKGKETGSSIAGGGRPQLAIIVRPTPLEAVRDISRAGELMPQKSTFFYPKLATGLWINPLA
ncbi:MAG: hypothetical protein CMJ35_09920 [Phycisphaerae bacterium]|nr:hypothetical protein [Phycisphaerae bacterium]MBM91912.1 hypothetical protein [Phycisphaerae bacterium]